MDEKEYIETHITLSFLKRTNENSISAKELLHGDPHKKEPDILYKDMGIEIGAILKGKNTHIDTYEENFFSAASESIDGKIPDTIQVKLVMQDDKDTVQREPLPQFKKYKYLPKFLDGIFVRIFKTNKVNRKVVLNQKSRMREDTFPNKNTTSKEFTGFIGELANFVNSLNEGDFRERDRYKLHHSVVTQGKVVGKPTNPLEDFVSQKILDKLCKDKYQGDYTKQVLLLHNYSILGNSSFTSDIHFYSHFRNDIFNYLLQQINKYNSFKLYSGIYFLDFSVYAKNSDFELIDFKTYSLREPSKFLNGYDEIRCDLKNAILNT